MMMMMMMMGEGGRNRVVVGHDKGAQHKAASRPDDA
jgi:hypothetical protein